MKKTLFLTLALAEITSAEVVSTVTLVDGTANATADLSGETINVTLQDDGKTDTQPNEIFAVGATITDTDDATDLPGNSDVNATVTSGSAKNWTAALGKGANHIGNISMTFQGDYTGTKTAFAALHASPTQAGLVTGDVTLTFNSGSYSSFTEGNDNSKDKGYYAVSVAGAYNSSIAGTVNIVINNGSFGNKYNANSVYNSSIIGGHAYKGNQGSIGATNLCINGGKILGNVYGGGQGGTITGDTAVTITNLTAFETHTADNLISAGGQDGLGTIEGNASVSFDNVNGSYAGMVSGGTNVNGTSTLNITNSTLQLSNVADFDTINLGKNTTLTVTGNITTGDKAQFSFSFDEEIVKTMTENGFGDGVVSGIFSGEGTFIAGDSATLNGKAIVAVNNNKLTLANTSVYYLIQGSTNIGNHGLDMPAEHDDIDAAYAWYTAKDTTLYIHEATNAYASMGDVLKNVHGEGSVVLRAAANQPDAYTYTVNLTGKTHATGMLLTAPDEAQGYKEDKHVHIHLGNDKESADISSFSNIVSYAETSIYVNGQLTAEEGRGHFNNVSSIGGNLYIYLNDQTYHFAGTTSALCTENEWGYLIIGNNTGKDVDVIIDNLVGSDLSDDLIGDWWTEYIEFGSCFQNVDSENKSTFSVEVKSIDTKGHIFFNANDLTVKANFNIEEGNKFWQKQYSKSESNLHTASLTLTGQGTYVLDEGMDIEDNFGKLSTEKNSDSYKWQGIVEVNNLDATDSENGTGRGIDYSFYGNEQSTVHFRGFKGDVVQWATDGTVADAQPDTITIVQDLQLTNTEKMNAYEVTGGISTQHYTGNISGTGDFVVSATENKLINLSGDLSNWEGELKTTAGNHYVTLSGSASTVNAAISASGGALNLSVNTPDTTTTFNKAVNVTSITVSDGSIATLTKESTAGNIRILGEAAELSQGINISASTLSNGHIAQAAITAVNTDTVLLNNITANDLRLYGNGVNFKSVLNEQFVQTGTANAINKVLLETAALSGITLANDGAKVELEVQNTVAWNNVVTDALNEVTIKLNGFTVEGLQIGQTYTDDYSAFLTITPTGEAAGVTVADLLASEYDMIRYIQFADGLHIYMTQAIPEPATTTLSLLALVGLVSRRRRK